LFKCLQKHIDEAYKQFVVLQQKTFLIWIEALDIEERETGITSERYVEYLKKENNTFTDMTCQATTSHHSHFGECELYRGTLPSSCIDIKK